MRVTLNGVSDDGAFRWKVNAEFESLLLALPLDRLGAFADQGAGGDESEGGLVVLSISVTSSSRMISRNDMEREMMRGTSGSGRSLPSSRWA